MSRASFPEPKIPEAARCLIGTERVSFYDVTLRDIKRYAQAIGDADPLYYDEAYAATTSYGAWWRRRSSAFP